MKAAGSGVNLHVQKYSLTVLTAPREPIISPGSLVTVTEGKRQELVCSSEGGSPDPQVKWYREGKIIISITCTTQLSDYINRKTYFVISHDDRECFS